MFRSLFVCLSVILTILCFITSCKKDSNIKDDIKSEKVEHTGTSNKHKGDKVIRDYKTINEESTEDTENINAETSEESSTEAEENTPEETDTRIYDVAEKLPEFPGGITALNKYINDNTTEVVKTISLKKSARAMVSCVIENNGTVSNAAVAKSSGNKTLDNEAVGIISKMPAWIPAQKEGRNVRMRYIVPVVFNPKNN